MIRLPSLLAALVLAAAAPVPASAAAATKASPAPRPKPDLLRRPYYGDLHLHTTLSFDAYVLMGTKTSPEDAYRFAKGEPVQYLGQPVRRAEPLDFLAVTDHSENIGVFTTLEDPNSQLSRSELGKKFREDGPGAFYTLVKALGAGKALAGQGVDTAAPTRSAWQRVVEAANAAYEPGRFTTFVGYEWTSMPNGRNLHRNVIFRGDRASFPFTSADSQKPEDLWTYLENQRAGGLEALAIPHNQNASGGLMYDWNKSDGTPIDQGYAQRRAVNEPLSEISQNKGQSETHPSLSPNDEFANFEIFDRLLIDPTPSDPHGSYVREAYGRGLVVEARTGVNPYRFGVVGGSDFHNGLSTSREDAYSGTVGGADPRAARPAKVEAPASTANPGPSSIQQALSRNRVLFGSGNLTGVWAEENTRESIYDAFRRKETFATSGSRLTFRFFGGWELAPGLPKAKDWVKTAYARGVPMGADLPARPASAKAPRFAAWAIKDPNGANLDRIQVVKVWLQGTEHREKVFDVSVARPARTAAIVPAAVGAAPAATGGATELTAVWEDPEFDPAVPAVYYLRVLEVPTPRWSTIDAARRGEPPPEGVPATIQERGWSSPIWYAPAKG